MKTDYIGPNVLERLLQCLMPENRAVLVIAARSGLRVGDVLRLKWKQVEPCTPGKAVWVHEQKTGKNKSFCLDTEMCAELFHQRGTKRYSEYIFPNRTDIHRPRTRQAVWRDLKRAAKLYRVDGKKIRENLGPHSTRKIYAVHLYRETGSLEAVQKALNHSDPTVSMLYAMADRLTEGRLGSDRITREGSDLTP